MGLLQILLICCSLMIYGILIFHIKIYFISIVFKLRCNMLSELPIRGLTSNNQLRYLLLEKNKLTSLPNEIANLKGLTALSLTDNPLGKL